jgi:hypothetical protein
MTLSENEKGEIIDYVKDNVEGESTCDDEYPEMLVFTFDKGGDQPEVSTDMILDLLKRGLFVLYSVINDNGKLEIAITNGEGSRL